MADSTPTGKAETGETPKESMSFQENMKAVIANHMKLSEEIYEEQKTWVSTISQLQTDMLILNPRVEDWIDEKKKEFEDDADPPAS